MVYCVHMITLPLAWILVYTKLCIYLLCINTNKVKIKVNKRNFQRIKKPLCQSQEVVDYEANLGVIKFIDNNKKFRIKEN